MPRDWNTLDIISLYKKGPRTDPNNYRGLSIMHVFAKLFATCLNAKLTDSVNEHDLHAEV